MSRDKINARKLIVQILLEIRTKNEYSSNVLSQFFQKYDYLERKEKAFIKRIVEGSLERQITLDYQINALSNTPVRKMKPFIRELLRMSAYQIFFMSGVPASATINEAVKLAKEKGFSGLSGFVNGVLRNLERQSGDLKFPDRTKDENAFLSVYYSMPLWIIEKLQSDYGRKVTECMLDNFLEIKPITIRFIRTLDREKREDLLSEMHDLGVITEKHPYMEEAYFLFNVSGVSSLPGFAEGEFTVQDVSSMLAVEATGIQEGQSVVDVCSAPGGKTAYAAMLAGTTGNVYAFDVSEFKTERIEENCRRLNLNRVNVAVRDARVLPSEAEVETADVVIADVPCLGLGVMGHKRDIKYRVQKEDLQSITNLQKEIVDASVHWLKPGGVFLYSTCSMTKEENYEMVQYLETKLNLSLESIEPFLPEEFLGTLDKIDLKMVQEGYLQLVPGKHKTDGFFFARLRKH